MSSWVNASRAADQLFCINWSRPIWYSTLGPSVRRDRSGGRRGFVLSPGTRRAAPRVRTACLHRLSIPLLDVCPEVPHCAWLWPSRLPKLEQLLPDRNKTPAVSRPEKSSGATPRSRTESLTIPMRGVQAGGHVGELPGARRVGAESAAPSCAWMSSWRMRTSLRVAKQAPDTTTNVTGARWRSFMVLRERANRRREYPVPRHAVDVCLRIYRSRPYRGGTMLFPPAVISNSARRFRAQAFSSAPLIAGRCSP